MNEPRICRICGKPFFAKTANQIFCSPECYDSRHHPKKPMQRKRCPICGKEFETTNSLAKYCSEECKVAGRQENDRKSKQRRMGRKQPEIRACLICGKEFKPKAGNQVCCSLECSKQNTKNTRAKWEAKRQKEKKKEKKYFAQSAARDSRRIQAGFAALRPAQKNTSGKRERKPGNSTKKRWSRKNGFV